MPIALPDDRAEEDKYVIIATETIPHHEGMQRYIILFLRGGFTLEETNALALAAFGDMAVIPLAAQYFHQGIVKVQSMGFSVDGGLPEKLQHLVDNYSILEFISCYEWHLLWHSVREYRELFRCSGDNSQGSAD